MKRWIAGALLCCVVSLAHGQAYVPMPSDTAVWRYRILDIGDFTQVLDNILFQQTGKDTVSGGNTYHKLYSRTHFQVEVPGSPPPIVPVTASAPDVYFAAIRESGKRVYLLSAGGDQVIFDFNVNMGDSIPAGAGKKKVVSTDSVLVNGKYHKRYNTNDPGYQAIEGVGSSRGILPYLNDGSGTTVFICATHGSDVYAPDETLPCTPVYSYEFVGVQDISAAAAQVNVFPVPATGVLRITTAPFAAPYRAFITNCIGQLVWEGDLEEKTELNISDWAPGAYLLTACPSTSAAHDVRAKFLVK